jgi:hypothetical protein
VWVQSAPVVNFEGRAGLSVTTRVQAQGSPIKAAWETTASLSVSGSVSFSVTVSGGTEQLQLRRRQADCGAPQVSLTLRPRRLQGSETPQTRFVSHKQALAEKAR